MKLKNIAGKKNISSFVRWKLSKLQEAGTDFKDIYPLMFSERDNVFYEWSRGYRILKRTYGESFDRIEAMRKTLKKRLERYPEDRAVGLALRNGPEWIEAFWAVLGAGCRPLLLNLRLPEKSLEEALSETGAVAVLTDERQFHGVENIDPVTLLTETAEAGAKTGKEALKGTDAAPEVPFGSCFYVMSSGTSGHVKVCAYTGEEVYHILFDSDAIVRKSKSMKKHFRGELKQLDFLPYYHIFGFVAVYLWFGFFSRTFVHLPDMAPETIVKTIRRHHVTHIFAVPLFWEKVYGEAIRTIKERGEETYRKFELGLKLSNALSSVPVLGKAFTKAALKEVRQNLFGESISFTISGGGPLRPEILRFFNGIGYHFANGYGMSEIGITSVELSENRKQLLKGSVGKPLSSVEYRIDEGGELLIGGPGRARFILSGGTKKDREDWYPSGDLAAEKKKRYYILGREDELIVGPSGENLNPNLYEAEFLAPGVREACILPVKTEGRFTPVLLLSLEPFTDQAFPETVRSFVREKLKTLQLSGEIAGIYMTSRPLIEGDEFKLPRRRLLADYEAGRLPEAAPQVRNHTENEDNLMLRVREILGKALDTAPEKILPRADFFTELGGSSLDYFTVLSLTEKEFNVPLPADKEHLLSTAEEISVYLREKMEN